MRLCRFFFSSRRRHTRYWRDWSSDVCSSDLRLPVRAHADAHGRLRGADRDRARAVERGAVRIRWPALRARGGRGPAADRKSVVQGKSVDLGGRRIIKKKKERSHRVALSEAYS